MSERMSASDLFDEWIEPGITVDVFGRSHHRTNTLMAFLAECVLAVSPSWDRVVVYQHASALGVPSLFVRMELEKVSNDELQQRWLELRGAEDLFADELDRISAENELAKKRRKSWAKNGQKRQKRDLASAIAEAKSAH